MAYGEKETIICETCGKPFEILKSIIKAKQNYGTEIKYCSKQCRYNSMKTGKIIKCKNCGKEFYSTRKIFCNQNCCDEYLNRRKTKRIYKYNNSHPLVKKFNSMYQRCYQKSNINYKNYGERGIKICDEWLYDRDKFVDWSLKNGYKEGLQIDRIDTNKNYEPNNCRFVNKTKNVRNRRITLKLLYNGEMVSLGEIAEKNGINYKLLWQRINRDKLTLEQALKII